MIVEQKMPFKKVSQELGGFTSHFAAQCKLISCNGLRLSRSTGQVHRYSVRTKIYKRYSTTTSTDFWLLNAKILMQILFSIGYQYNSYDNAVAENFISCLKCECSHHYHFSSRAYAFSTVFSYIEGYYKCIRPHSSIFWLCPNSFEKSFLN